jgi:thioredoxin reductase
MLGRFGVLAPVAGADGPAGQFHPHRAVLLAQRERAKRRPPDGGDGHLEHLLLRDRETGQTATAPAAGLFILIGARRFTGWLPEAIDRDWRGVVLTGADTASWPLQRAPFLLETSLPGVFAAGDVRHGSVKRVACAAGEGSIVIRLVHDYLALAPRRLG